MNKVELQFYNGGSLPEEIPTQPGIYAWFVPIVMTEGSDYEDVVKDLWHILAFDVNSEGVGQRDVAVDFRWPKYQLNLSRVYRKRSNTDRLSELWKNLAEKHGTRREFSTLLQKASLFMKPLYVGCASNLRTRFEEHASEGSDFSDRFLEHLRNLKKEKTAKLSFEERQEAEAVVTPLNYQMNELLFAALPFSAETVSVLAGTNLTNAADNEASEDNRTETETSYHNLLEQIMMTVAQPPYSKK